MDSVNNIKEAYNWFINHSTGKVKCIYGNNYKICESYPEADNFFYLVNPGEKEKIDAISNVSHHKTINENPDSLEIGTPSKGGAVKIYGDYNDVDTFKKKIDNAKAVKDYAQAKLMVNI